MKAKTSKQAARSEKQKPLSAASAVLLGLAVLFMLPGLAVFIWYGLTYIPAVQTSEFPARELTVSYGTGQCTLEIPDGTLTLRHPVRAAVGSSYSASAEVRLSRAPRISACTGPLPNWNINLEAQTSFVSAGVTPFASIRQPAVNRDTFLFEWTFTPEETVPVYQSRLWLRMIVSEQDQTIERWNMLARDFPMENAALFGQPTVLWLIAGSICVLLGILLLILLIQRQRAARNGHFPA